MRLNLQNTPTDTDYIRHSAAAENGAAWSRFAPWLWNDVAEGRGPGPLVGYLRTMATAYIHCGVSAGHNNANANLLLFDYSIRSRALRLDVNTI